MPWTAASFRRQHNHNATPAEARLGAQVANAALKRGADDGAAVRAGNTAILDRRLAHQKKRQ
jgi:hypothetical protein